MRIRTLRSVLAGLGLAALAAVGPTAGAAADDEPRGRQTTRTPIGHLIVVVGENHTFDNLFGGYQPADDQTVSNLLSKGIIKADGTPGPNFASAAQQQASDTKVYLLAPAKTGRYATLPQPQTTYAVGVPPGVPDARFPADLPNGPFQITKYVPHDSFTGDPIHTGSGRCGSRSTRASSTCSRGSPSPWASGRRTARRHRRPATPSRAVRRWASST